MQGQAGLVRGEFDEVSAYLRQAIRVDPTFAEFVRRCRAREASLTIVSSGVERIIAERLAEVGIRDVAIVANGLVADPSGWRLVFRDDVPNGTDKAVLVERAAASGARTVFVGDGRSDFDAALAAEVRFAKRGAALERFLTERSVPFEPFSNFEEIADRLFPAR
jgi:2-hydroxy-3-keto-5-methylthiopentenyl-1-phosphate phosphatase